MPVQTLADEAAVRAWITDPAPGWLFKHSSSCGVSAGAWEDFESYLNNNPSQRAAYVVVQTQRPLSNLIAEITKVVHQSPQLFLVAAGSVLWRASHWSITAAAMNAAWQSAKSE